MTITAFRATDSRAEVSVYALRRRVISSLHLTIDILLRNGIGNDR